MLGMTNTARRAQRERLVVRELPGELTRSATPSSPARRSSGARSGPSPMTR